MKFEIKYQWSPTTSDPSEVTSVTLMSSVVPRVGENINLLMDVDGEIVNIYMKVKTVDHVIRNIRGYILIYLG